MDNFNVQPVMDGYSAETNMEIDQFFGSKDIFRNDKKSNYDTQELYDILDEIDTDVSEVEDTLDHYDEEFCGKGGEKCFTCKRPDLPEYAEFEQCGNPLDTDNNIPLNEMLSQRRSRPLARPRQIAMFLSKKMTTRSLPEIGRRFANRDHTTVIHAVKTITRLSEQDDEMKKNINKKAIIG